MNLRADVAGLLLIALAVLRIGSTWTVFSATLDEGMHVAAGLQILTRHEPTWGRENPPLPRLVFAVAPALAGVSLDPRLDVHEQQRAVFHAHGRYQGNLALARLGNLVFFVIASLCVRAWARRELGSGGGLVAVLLFTLQPVVAGHAGLATPDIAGAAGVAVAFVAFLRWLDEPSLTRAAWFGAGFGFAVLCKFSALGFVPAACAALYIVRILREPQARVPVRNLLRALLAAVVCAELVIWIGYGFSFERFAYGLHRLAQINEAGHLGYLFGELREKGWWWYFPVALGLKSTIASLALGLGALLLRRERAAWESMAAVAAMLAVAMAGNINIGVRHVLPLYVPLSVGGAAAALTLWRARKWIAVALLVWHGVASVSVHPDAFAYFNEAAGRQPWRLLSDSNIDWGQDAGRLVRVAREKKIERIALAVVGNHDWDALGLPPRDELRAGVQSRGWIAVSEYSMAVRRVAPWLEGRPYERVGRSIRLYFVR
jgi:4-amino-4-deoxy-L-arabinose transferase-like glycosyltransferase